MFRCHRLIKKNKVLALIVLAIRGATALVAFLSFIVPVLALGRRWLIVFSLLMLMASYVWHLTFEHAFIRLCYPAHVLIVGAGWAGKTMASVLATIREFHLIGLVDDDADKRKSAVADVPVLGGTADLMQIVDHGKPHVIVLAIMHEKPGGLTRQGGRPLKMLTVVDEYTRECLAVAGRRRMSATEGQEVLGARLQVNR